jgi:hypothetical protein
MISAFMPSDSSPDNCLKIWGNPPAFNGVLTSLSVENGISYVFFIRPSEAAAALEIATQSGLRAELLNGQALATCALRLSSVPLPVDWNCALLFVQRLGQEVTAPVLREELESLMIGVEAAFPNLIPGNGSSRGNGTVLVTRQTDGAMLVDRFQGRYAIFRTRGGYTLPPLAQQRYEFPSPPQGKHRPSPREWMKQFAMLNFADSQNEIELAINGLSVNDTWELVSDVGRFTRWIEEVVAQIKQT